MATDLQELAGDRKHVIDWLDNQDRRQKERDDGAPGNVFSAALRYIDALERVVNRGTYVGCDRETLARVAVVRAALI